MRNPEMKPLFVERMKELLGKEFSDYEKILKIPPVRSIRCNTLKISPAELKKRLESNGWKIGFPWKKYPEVMIVEGKIVEKIDVVPDQTLSRSSTSKIINKKGNHSEVQSKTKLEHSRTPQQKTSNLILTELAPGELGRALEHLLGYYYIQELASMLPVLALKPVSGEQILDLASAPGSKTTQIASHMKNNGLIIANEVSLGRIKILSSNLERCGVSCAVITKKEGFAFCNKMKKLGKKFDRILVDAPCSGEGTLRSSPKTYLMWNIKTVKTLSKLQKKLVSNAIDILKVGGELVYSTCTHAPEENEGVVDYILKEFGDKMKIEKIDLPVKCRAGITSWKDEKYLDDVKHCCRIYPQDDNTEGFFISKFRKIKQQPSS